VAARSPTQCPAGSCTRDWIFVCSRVAADKPVVEQARGDADATGDGGGGVVRGLGLYLVEDGCGKGDVALRDRLDHRPQHSDHEFRCFAYRVNESCRAAQPRG
jgi:hypothetical protein